MIILYLAAGGVYLAYILVVVAIFGVGYLVKGKKTGIFFAAIFIAATLGPDTIKNYIKERLERQVSEDENTAANKSLIALRDRCSREETFVQTKPVLVGQSVFVDINPGSEAPTAHTMPEVERTITMEWEWRLTGKSFPPISNYRQYGSYIYWAKNASKPDEIGDLMKAESVDYKDGFDYMRRASLARWKADGLYDYVLGFSKRKSAAWAKLENWPTDKIGPPVPVEKPEAKYIFTIEDISSMDDRKHWLAKGRIRLVDAKTSDIVAEYVSFQSLLVFSAVCPKAREKTDLQKKNWNVLEFFFGNLNIQ